MMRPPASMRTVLLCGVTWLLPSLGWAEETAPAVPRAQTGEAAGQPVLAVPVVDEAALIAKLRSTTESDAVADARKLAEVKTASAQAALFDALAIGVSPKVAAAALTALAAQKSLHGPRVQCRAAVEEVGWQQREGGTVVRRRSSNGPR